jgi:Flp pilus assembly protein TadB
MNLLGGIFILLVALLIIAAVGLGLLIALVILVFGQKPGKLEQESTARTNNTNQENPPKGSTDERIAEVSKKIDNYHAEDVKRAKGDRYERIGFVTFGFAVATTGLAAVRINIISTIVSIIMAVAFWVIGAVLMLRSRKYR